MRAALLVGGGILIGVGLTWVEAQVSAEKKAREVYDKQLESHKRVMAMSNTLKEQWLSEAPVETEDELTFNPEGSALETPVATPKYVQAYVAQAQSYGDPETFQDQLSLSEITEDDYEEDDGREKEIIQVFMGDGEPYFVQDGMVIEDWREKIGDTILVSFYQRFPPNHTGPRTIYLRNNHLDVDYEVTQEMGP